METMISEIDELMKKLEQQGKLTKLSDDECRQIDEDIHQQMAAFRVDFAKKQAQSIKDTSKIILNS